MKLNKFQVIIKTIQRCLVTILLIVIYIFGFGITRILMIILRKNVFRTQRLNPESFWIKAEGYSCDPDEIIRQS